MTRILWGGAAAAVGLLVATSVADAPNGDVQFFSTDCDATEVIQFRVDGGPALDLQQPAVGLRAGLYNSLFIPNVGDAEGDGPSQVVFTDDGTKLLISHRETQNVIVMDAATRTVLRDIAVSGTPQAVAVTSNGQVAVTANLFEDTVSFLDVVNGVEFATVPVGDQPVTIRITPNDAFAVVGNAVDGTLSVIEMATQTVVRTISGFSFVATLSFNFESAATEFSFNQFEVPNNTTVVYPDYFNARVALVNIGTGAVTSLPTANNPRGIAVNPAGTFAVISHPGTGVQTVTLVDVAGLSIANTYATGVDLDFRGAITLNPAATACVFAVQNNCRLLNLTTGAVGPNISTASANDLLTTASGNYALVVGFRGSLIDYSTGAVVKELNNLVSTAIGAASPVGPRAALIATTFGEDLLLVNTNGAAGFVESQGSTGADPAADRTRDVAVSSDGTLAASANILIDTATIFDLTTDSVRFVVPVGNRPSEPEFTPDGSLAVVANLDSDFASVIDTTTGSVTNITISTRASVVETSPDGQYAYLGVVASGDGVWRINLNTLAVDGPKILTGNMGSVGFLYQQSSGMTLSPDGSTLCVCGSFDDNVSIIDTASWTEVARVPAGDFPVYATFSADSSTIYVSARDDDTIRVIDNNGAASTQVASIPVGDQPWETVTDSGGNFLYVLNYGARTISKIDLGTNAVVGTSAALTLTPGGLRLVESAGHLVVPTGSSTTSIGPGPKVAQAQSGSVEVLDAGTLGVLDSINTGLSVGDIEISATDTLVLGAPQGDGLIVLTPVVTCAGDLTGDNVVDFADFGQLSACWGQPCGDLTGDAMTDFDDFATLSADWGCGL